MKLKFFLTKVLSSMVLSYIIPIINIVIIVLLSNGVSNDKIVVMNGINILTANNACYIASISSYYKINEKYNMISGYIKTLGLVISAVAFAISTYELQRNNFGISVIVYEICAAVTSILCIILTVFVQLENVEIDKRIEKSQLERAKDIISRSGEKASFDLDGDHFQV